MILRTPQTKDIEARLGYGADPDISIMYGVAPTDVKQPTREKMEAWLEDSLKNPNYWIIETEGEAAGAIFLHSQSLENRRARLAVGMFHKRFMGLGLGAAAIRLVLSHAFTHLELHRVDLRVLAYNERAIACYKKVGFIMEGTEREASWVDGRWHNDVFMSILEHEFS